MTNRTPRFPIELIFSALSALFISLPLQAQNTFDLAVLELGQLILNLNATEQVSVEQDTLNVAMQFSVEGRDSTDLQNEVNQAIREARDILEGTNNIEYSIQQYNVYRVQQQGLSRNPTNSSWRAQQNIQMQSMNSEALLVVTARIQQSGLTVSNMNYSLSGDRYQQHADELLDAALLQLQVRADRVAVTLGKENAELVEVNINGSQNFFDGRVAMAEFRSLDTAMAVPVAEPGETQVSVTVNARALLSP
ncbi:MAG: SIMPL domain-containing protein [Gammaproteobacteria bacterium]|nr:SIMPL domain-containing protein [Gammaproteobacteria bacterium]